MKEHSTTSLGASTLAITCVLLKCAAPEATAEPVGQTSSPASGSGSVIWVDTIGNRGSPSSNGDLRGLTGSSGQIAIVKGFWASGDGGGGEFYWDSSCTDDGGTQIVPNTNAGANTVGACWHRIYSGALNIKWFGARGNGLPTCDWSGGCSTPDDTTYAFTLAFSAIENADGTTGSDGVIFIPKGQYRLNAAPNPLTAAITIRGEGGPAGGTGAGTTNYLTNFPEILHDFNGDLFTFSGGAGNGYASGGGIENLRIAQIWNNASCNASTAGSAIVASATDSSHRPSWLQFNHLTIERGGDGACDAGAGGASWTWAINIDGSGSTDGIPNVFIGDVRAHTTSANGSCTAGYTSGALNLNATSGVLVHDCQFHDVGAMINISGPTGNSAAEIHLSNVEAKDLVVDNASDVSAFGGEYSNVCTTSNTRAPVFFLPGRLAYSFTDGAPSGAAAMGRFWDSTVTPSPSNLAGSMRFSQPIALANGQSLWGLNGSGGTNPAVSLIGVDSSNHVQLGMNNAASVQAGAQFVLASTTFSALPASPVNGTLLYCSDCKTATSCAGSGSGAIAKRVNSAWVCN
jgi:hypothetical protein